MKKIIIITALLMLALSFVSANIQEKDSEPTAPEVEKPAQPSVEDYQKLSVEVKERITDIVTFIERRNSMRNTTYHYLSISPKRVWWKKLSSLP